MFPAAFYVSAPQKDNESRYLETFEIGTVMTSDWKSMSIDELYLLRQDVAAVCSNRQAAR